MPGGHTSFVVYRGGVGLEPELHRPRSYRKGDAGTKDAVGAIRQIEN
jgi:hypothetical protein